MAYMCTAGNLRTLRPERHMRLQCKVAELGLSVQSCRSVLALVSAAGSQQGAAVSNVLRCQTAGLQIPSYIQICGIILGMITIGYLGDRIGRKWGSVTTISIMFVRFPLF